MYDVSFDQFIQKTAHMENQMIIKNFGILYRTFLNYISKSIASKDLSFSDSVFLVNIGENEGISQEEIASALAIDKAAIARSVKNMERKGYIKAKSLPATKGRKNFIFRKPAASCCNT